MDVRAMANKNVKRTRLPRCQLMEYFLKANLFVLCCIAACLSLLTYLSGFACEVAWILESRGDLPMAAHLLCAEYFILFVASTILIHGLVTGLAWGLFSWSVVIGVCAIPELCLVMYTCTQFWGLQSTHGLTELIGYLVRLVVNCLALLCVIPTGLRWRREKQILKQLQSLANRLQLSTPPPSSPQHRCHDAMRNSQMVKHSVRNSRRPSGVDNPAFIAHETQVNAAAAAAACGGGMPMFMPYPPVYNSQFGFGSRNEFNASIFGLNPSMPIGPVVPAQKFKRTQSLLDLRYVIPPQLHTHSKVTEIDEKYMINNKNKTTTQHTDKQTENADPIYYTIGDSSTDKSAGKALARNCVSLENLGTITATIKNDLNAYGHNLLQNHQWPMSVGLPPNSCYQPYQFYIPVPYGYPNSFAVAVAGLNSNINSRQSLGNESDDYRKYRDVAL